MATFPSKVNYATGDILTATNMNDVGGAINLLDGAQRSAGKNAIINGDLGIWQRGTTFNASVSGTYTADRWFHVYDGTATWNITQQTFTPGTAPVAGYEGQYYYQAAMSANTSCTYFDAVQRIEDVRTYAGQTVTMSFWAKADSARTSLVYLFQNFGTGGSGLVVVSTPSITYSTSWARYTFTITVPSVSGKTIGAGSNLQLGIRTTATSGSTLQIWGVQLEAASTASNFQTATGTKQGELAACQRYYWRSTGVEAYGRVAGQGIAASTTSVLFAPALPVSMRTYPSSVDYSTLCIYDGVTITAISSLTLQSGAGSLNTTSINAAVTGATAFRPYFLAANNSTSGYIGFSAEL
jgi:hypothetical protein